MKTESETMEVFRKKLQKKYFIDPVLGNDIFDEILNQIEGALINTERVEIRDFGNFSHREYKSYTGRNPKTGEIIDVKEKTRPFFKVGKKLRDDVRESQKSWELQQ